MDIKKALLVKSLREFTKNHSLTQLQQQTQATNGPEEKIRRILRSHKTRSFFYYESTLYKLLCKPKDWVATEDKKNIDYEIACSNFEAVYFGVYERSLKWRSHEHKRSVRNCDYDKNETAKHCYEADHNFSWDQN